MNKGPARMRALSFLGQGMDANSSIASGRTRVLRIAAAVVIGPDGRSLVVRKHGSTIFMQPGGKIDPGETPLAALVRELHEELGLRIPAEECRPLGRFRAAAANEADAMVEAEAYEVRTDQPVAAQAEIAEIAWIDPHAPGDMRLAELSRDHILPAWRHLYA